MRIYQKPDVQYVQITNEKNIANNGFSQWLEVNQLNSTDGITVFPYDMIS